MNAQEEDVEKILKLLRRSLTGKLSAGAIAFMFVYVVGGGKAVCPLCGNQGIHPWEWSGAISL